jgi:AcrR family transcriptional regulator
VAPRVKATTKRAYSSAHRREQAAVTRTAILEAAQRLFERDGYAATTVAAIAADAGVALKTVYVAFDSKSGLLRALWNFLLRGDEDDLAVSERAWYREILEEADPERQLRLMARNSRAVKLRIGVLLEVIRGAAPTDPEIGELWERIQNDFGANQGAIVDSLIAKDALAEGIDRDRATDILWALNLSTLWQLLVRERGWSPEDYEQLIATMACAQLLEQPRRTDQEV